MATLTHLTGLTGLTDHTIAAPITSWAELGRASRRP